MRISAIDAANLLAHELGALEGGDAAFACDKTTISPVAGQARRPREGCRAEAGVSACRRNRMPLVSKRTAVPVVPGSGHRVVVARVGVNQ